MDSCKTGRAAAVLAIEVVERQCVRICQKLTTFGLSLTASISHITIAQSLL